MKRVEGRMKTWSYCYKLKRMYFVIETGYIPIYFENWEFARQMIFEMTGTWIWISTIVVSPAVGNQELVWWWLMTLPDPKHIIDCHPVIQLKIPIENLSFPWSMKIQKILSAGRLVNVPALKLYISVTINISLQYRLSVRTASSRS